jgi:hypothetical protein
VTPPPALSALWRFGWKHLLAARPAAAELGKKADEDPLVKACDRYMTVRRFAPTFLESFTFRASSDKHALLAAIELLKRLNAEPRRAMPERPPTSFLPKAWQRLIVKEGKVDRRQYEIATLAVLCRRLASGDIWIDGTRNYQQFDRYLLAKTDVTEKAKALAAPMACDDYVQERSRLLDWRLHRFANALRHDRLQGVVLQKGRDPTVVSRGAIWAGRVAKASETLGLSRNLGRPCGNASP